MTLQEIEHRTFKSRGECITCSEMSWYLVAEVNILLLLTELKNNS